MKCFFYNFPQLPDLVSISQYARNMTTDTAKVETDQTCNIDLVTEDDIPEIIDFLKTYFFKVIILMFSYFASLFMRGKTICFRTSP